MQYATSVKFKIALVILLGLVHIIYSITYVVPGYLSIDEAFYHWMAISFSDSGSLSLWNGYAEFPSPELRHAYLNFRNGSLYAPFPYLFPVIALPFQKMAGFSGLFFLNALSFIGVIGLCFLIARKLFQDTNLALNACLVLGLATFAWEYSQAAWPHTISSLFVCGEFYLCVLAFYAESQSGARLLAAAAGLVAGFAMGIRVDSVLAFPGLVLPFLFVRPWRITEALLVMVGSIPGLLILTFTNYVKFGRMSPLAYYPPTFDAMPPLMVIAFVAVLILALWILTRSQFIQFSRTHKLQLALSGVILVLITTISSVEFREFIADMLHNAYIFLLDIRSLPLETSWSPMTRTSDGGVVYMGALKKSLLQSLPFLAVLLVPVFRLIRGDRDFNNLELIIIIPITYLGYFTYSFISQEAGGGMALNMRYCITIIPLLVILCAYAFRELDELWGRCFQIPTFALICILTVGVHWLVTRKLAATIDQMEIPLLIVPLILASFIAILSLVALIGRFPKVEVLRVTAWTVLIVSMVWSGMTAFFYDYPFHRHVRTVHKFYSQALQKHVPDNSIFFTANRSFTVALMLKTKDRIRIAVPQYDGFKDFPKLLEFHSKAGRKIFAFFPKDLWPRLKSDFLQTYKVSPLIIFPDTNFLLSEISLRPK